MAVQIKRTHKSAELRREEILAAASRVFAEAGYRTADVQQIAELAGVGKGTVYRHFQTKEDLFLAALDANLRQLIERMHDVRTQNSDPLEQMYAAAHAYLQYFDEHPETVELFIHERAEFRDRAKPLYFAYSDKHRDEWLALFETLQAQGRLRVTNIDAAMQAIAELLYGAVLANHVSTRHRPLASRHRELLDICLHGIIADPEDAPVVNGDTAVGRKRDSSHHEHD